MAFIPDEAVYSAHEVSHAAFKLFACYCAHRNRRNGLSWPSRSLIHRETGISITYISTLRGELLKRYWIEIKDEKVRPLRGFVDESESNDLTEKLNHSTSPKQEPSDYRTSASDDSIEELNYQTGQSSGRTVIKEEPYKDPVQEQSHEPTIAAPVSSPRNPLFRALAEALQDYNLDETIVGTRLRGHLKNLGSAPLKRENRQIRQTAESVDEMERSLQDKDSTADIRTSDSNAEAEEVFAYWQTVMEKPKAKLTRERRHKIAARLREGYTIEQCIRAIDGCRRSTFHMGANDQGRRYDDLELIFRSGSKLESFIQCWSDWEKSGGNKRNAESIQRIVGGAAPKPGKYDSFGT